MPEGTVIFALPAVEVTEELVTKVGFAQLIVVAAPADCGPNAKSPAPAAMAPAKIRLLSRPQTFAISARYCHCFRDRIDPIAAMSVLREFQ
jgi:hypothetical protein